MPRAARVQHARHLLALVFRQRREPQADAPLTGLERLRGDLAGDLHQTLQPGRAEGHGERLPHLHLARALHRHAAPRQIIEPPAKDALGSAVHADARRDARVLATPGPVLRRDHLQQHGELVLFIGRQRLELNAVQRALVALFRAHDLAGQRDRHQPLGALHQQRDCIADARGSVGAENRGTTLRQIDHRGLERIGGRRKAADETRLDARELALLGCVDRRHGERILHLPARP